MATELADRVAIAAAMLLLDGEQPDENGELFVPAADAEDGSRCLWIEDHVTEVGAVRGWLVSVKAMSELAGLDQTPLAPLGEEAPGGEG